MKAYALVEFWEGSEIPVYGFVILVMLHLHGFTMV